MRQVGRRSRVAPHGAQSKAASAVSERTNLGGRANTIVYIDRYALTRHCVANELAKLLLPEFALAAFSSLAEARRDAGLLKRCCCIIYCAQSLPIEDAQVNSDLCSIHEVVSGIPIVMLSNLEAAGNVVGAMRQGVAGYIPTSLLPRIASEAVRLVVAGGTFIPASALSSGMTRRERLGEGRSIDSAAAAIGLTPRQSEVLHHLWKGEQNKAIASELRMSENTVKVHVKHIMKKLGAHNRTQAVLMTQEMFGQSEPAEAQEIAQAESSASAAINGSDEAPRTLNSPATTRAFSPAQN